jgi:signal transduction histidine kinase
MPHPRWWREALVITIAGAAELYGYAGDRAWRWGGMAPAWLVPVMTVVFFAGLFLRWRFPVAVFLVHWLYALMGLLMPNYAPFAGVLVALHAVGCRTATRMSLLLLALCVVPFAVNGVNLAAGGSSITATAFTIAWMVLAAAVWAVGRRTYMADQRTVLLWKLQASEAEEAVRAERLRLARDLHDIVSHAVSAMILQAAGARALLEVPDDRVHQALVSIETAGVQAMGELHRLLGLLRSVEPDLADDPSATQPGLADVPALVEMSRQSGLDVECNTEGTITMLDRSVDVAAYRVVQEAVTNALKHGGSGAYLRLRQIWGGDSLTITARSSRGPSGDGPRVPSAGVGLRGLAERVNLVGGRLDAGPAGESFVLTAELPLRRTGSGPGLSR